MIYYVIMVSLKLIQYVILEIARRAAYFVGHLGLTSSCLYDFKQQLFNNYANFVKILCKTV